MLDTLRGTPLWVYAVFFVLTYYGVIACFKNQVSKKSLQITPAMFVVMSLVSLNLSQGVAIPLSLYVLGILAGWVMALRFHPNHSVEREG